MCREAQQTQRQKRRLQSGKDGYKQFTIVKSKEKVLQMFYENLLKGEYKLN